MGDFPEISSGVYRWIRRAQLRACKRLQTVLSMLVPLPIAALTLFITEYIEEDEALVEPALRFIPAAAASAMISDTDLPNLCAI